MSKNLLEEQAEALYKTASRVAEERGAACIAKERWWFAGRSSGQEYTLDCTHRSLSLLRQSPPCSCSHREVSIEGPDFKVLVTYDDYGKRSGVSYSINVSHGSIPKNLTEILEGLEPDKKRIAEMKQKEQDRLSASFRQSTERMARNEIAYLRGELPSGPWPVPERMLRDEYQREGRR